MKQTKVEDQEVQVEQTVVNETVVEETGGITVDTGAEASQEQPQESKQPTILSIDDISSPSLGNFNLKSGGKTHVMITPEKLERLELPVFDEKTYAKRNDYTNLVKHTIARYIQEGKFNRPDVTIAWGADVNKYPMPTITAPKAKAEKAANKPDELVFDLGLTAQG